MASNLQGSPMTPYIYDSRADITDIAKQLKNIHSLGKEELDRRGLVGREWAITNGFTRKGMCAEFLKSVQGIFNSWTPRERFTLLNTNEPNIKYPDGIIFDSIKEEVI